MSQRDYQLISPYQLGPTLLTVPVVSLVIIHRDDDERIMIQ
jgi:hypothetical protein